MGDARAVAQMKGPFLAAVVGICAALSSLHGAAQHPAYPLFKPAATASPPAAAASAPTRAQIKQQRREAKARKAELKAARKAAKKQAQLDRADPAKRSIATGLRD
jgi:Skp family chaperone for outer membrane proteins